MSQESVEIVKRLLWNGVEQIVAEGERVLVLSRLYGRMAGTENEVEALFAGVYLMRDGKVARAE